MIRDEPVRPDYEGAWIGAVVPALLTGEGAPWMPAPARDAERAVLLVLDGLGQHALDSHGHRLPELSAMQGTTLTTVAPSTTAAALTSITTGLPPARHGVVGYRMRVSGEVLNVLGWKTSGRHRGPDPAVVQPQQPFPGHRVGVVTRAEFQESGFTAAHLREATFLGWRTPSTLVEHVRRQVAGGARFTYAYYDGVDKVAHEFGPASGFFRAEVIAADDLVGHLRDVLPPEVALVVTADHGQLDVGPDDVVGLDGLDGAVAAYSGESRFRSLHARTGATADLLQAARAGFSDRAWVFARDELFDEGWLGSGATGAVRGRMGDVVLAAHAGVAFADPGETQENTLVGRHGSLTLDEMVVPLLAAHGRA
ncbi:MAG: nucleotide pyrophosphatase/phosphodiesterase family protein [Egibacteraceae bacterium]